ncbi:HigA family addiction module antitoxin [Methylobacterium durans]|uniref:Addiction module antidote protein, HigA family n=1 Tax=Methylobacterium durans TaxID=2202825 RepID=A0A2U8W8W1_9HYPH|nr:HigA family addiction module antitoxin [Methylobacterium durans]AWN41752.1 addiction module antidote protein, HigA family [Methylobacterium durans]
MADFAPTHPGEVLREDFLLPLGLSQYALAKAIAVPETRISEIIRGRRSVSAETALRLARYFGTSPEFWMGMQATYDLEMARDATAPLIEKQVQPRAA